MLQNKVGEEASVDMLTQEIAQLHDQLAVRHLQGLTTINLTFSGSSLAFKSTMMRSTNPPSPSPERTYISWATRWSSKRIRLGEAYLPRWARALIGQRVWRVYRYSGVLVKFMGQMLPSLKTFLSFN